MYKNLAQFKQDHKLFFKNGNINGHPEVFRVWKGYLITLAWIDPDSIRARAWKENNAGVLTCRVTHTQTTRWGKTPGIRATVTMIRKYVDADIMSTALNSKLAGD